MIDEAHINHEIDTEEEQAQMRVKTQPCVLDETANAGADAVRVEIAYAEIGATMHC